MEEGSFCYARLRVAGIVNDKTEPFYSGPKFVCVPIDANGHDIQPTTVFYFDETQLVEMDIVRNEIYAIQAYKRNRPDDQIRKACKFSDINNGTTRNIRDNA